jgi:uncharacterized protein (DUF58 family)
MTNKTWWTFLAVLFGLSVILGHRGLFFFAVLLALASGASVLWYRYCLYGVTYRRKFASQHVFSGEETELRIEITNAKPLPLPWLLVRDGFPKNMSLLTGVLQSPPSERDEAKLYGAGPTPSDPSASNGGAPVVSLTDTLSLRWYERVQRTYRIQAQQRGVYAFGPADVTSGDIFGFGQRTTRFQGLDSLVVYPRVYPIEQLGLPVDLMPAEKPGGEFKAVRRIIQDPLRMAAVREYVPGDSIRHIHWKSTARLNRLQTKVFDPSASPVVTLFADVQTVHNPYGFVSEHLELIVAATASLALHALDLRQAVGLMVNGGPSGSCDWTLVPAGRTTGQGARILESLAPLTGFRLQPLYQILRRSMPLLPYGSTVVVITARPIEEVCVSLLNMKDAGHPVVLLTVGDEKPDVPAFFDTYYLGGRDAWRRLEALELA